MPEKVTSIVTPPSEAESLVGKTQEKYQQKKAAFDEVDDHNAEQIIQEYKEAAGQALRNGEQSSSVVVDVQSLLKRSYDPEDERVAKACFDIVTDNVDSLSKLIHESTDGVRQNALSLLEEVATATRNSQTIERTALCAEEVINNSQSQEEVNNALEILARLSESGQAAVYDTITRSLDKYTAWMEEWTSSEAGAELAPPLSKLCDYYEYILNAQEASQAQATCIKYIKKGIMAEETRASTISLVLSAVAETEHGASIMNELLQEEFGFSEAETKFIESAWWEGAAYESAEEQTYYYYNVVSSNLETMKNLETERGKIVKTLFDEFGIANFARYPEEILIDQYDNKDKDIEYGILIGAITDKTGPFYQDLELHRQLYADLKELNIGFRISEATGGLDVTKRLLRFDNRYGDKNKISFAIGAGHGYMTGIVFGEGFGGSVTTKGVQSEITQRIVRGEEDTREFKKRKRGRPARKIFTNDAAIILNACNTAKEPTQLLKDTDITPLAKEVEKQTGLTVIASQRAAHLKSWHIYKDKEGKLAFDIEWKDEDAAVTFTKGQRFETGSTEEANRLLEKKGEN